MKYFSKYKYLTIIPVFIVIIMYAGTLTRAESTPPPATQSEIEYFLGHWQTSEEGVFIHFFGTLADKAARPYKNLIAVISGGKLADYEGATSIDLSKRKRDVYCAFPLIHNLLTVKISNEQKVTLLAAERDGLINKELENYYMVIKRIGPPLEIWKPEPTTDTIVANIIHRGPTEPDMIACSPVVMRSLGLTPLFIGEKYRSNVLISPPTKVTAYLIKKGPLVTSVFDKQFEHPTVIVSIPIGQED